ncbi:MAG TPA: hypothetical protein VGR28_00550 [Candidatus Thermoplasmatota archaeon]|jgi:hypothetical protein|nr:hypothetical protein [Candidatus Thermoplasmatota archaeon]
MPRTVAPLLAALLLLAPAAAADPVQDLYNSVAAFYAGVDGSVQALGGVAGGAAAGAVDTAETLAAPATSLADAALAGVAPGGLPLAHEWIAVGSASGTFVLSSGGEPSRCDRMTAVVEHRPGLSNEPNFVLTLTKGDQASLICTSGLRNTFDQHHWSGDAAQGWHARVENTPDAVVIDVVIGPAGADGARPMHIYWDAGVNGVVGIFVLDGTLTEVMAR